MSKAGPKILELNEKTETLVLLEAVDVLKRGGVVVVPTDTLYGLAADATNERAVQKVFSIKGRDAGKPLPVLVSDFAMMNTVALLSEKNRDRIAKFDTVTAVLPARGWMPLNLRAGQLTIGVRIPQHPFLLRLIKMFGGAITGTSANKSGGSSHTHIQYVVEDFQKGRAKPDLIIDAGNLGEHSASMIVDFTKEPAQVIRTGPMSKEALLAFLSEEQSQNTC